MVMYKCINGLAPDNLVQSERDSKVPYSCCTRSQSSGNIYIDSSRTDWGRRTFTDSGARLWNNLPTIIVKNSVNVQSFKVKLKLHTIEPPL